MQDSDGALPDAALEAFMAHCSERVGESYFRTPRNTVTAFVNLLSVLEQNPGVEWHDLIERINVAPDVGDDMSDLDEATGAREATEQDEQLTSFRL